MASPSDGWTREFLDAADEYGLNAAQTQEVWRQSKPYHDRDWLAYGRKEFRLSPGEAAIIKKVVENFDARVAESRDNMFARANARITFNVVISGSAYSGDVKQVGPKPHWVVDGKINRELTPDDTVALIVNQIKTAANPQDEGRRWLTTLTNAITKTMREAGEDE